MDETEDTGLPREIRGALAICVALLVLLALLTLLDLQLKRSMVDTALNFRREVEHARGQRTGPPPAPGVPGARPGVHGGGRVADDPGAPEADVPAEAPPFVRPGDESARPPHRGSIDGA